MPLYLQPGGGVTQSVFLEVAADTTTGSASFVQLMSQAITISAGGILLITFEFSISNTANSGTEVDFQMLIDGVATRGTGTGTKSSGLPSSGGLIFRKTGLSAGSHTIAIQWRTASGTAQLRPVTTIVESGSLLLMEVTA